MIKKILVANRGEIAMRIFRTCRVMNISTVAVYTHVDRGALHVRYAEEAYCISESPEDTSYLKPELILSIAKKTGAAIHPGYGFLSENADFARRCNKVVDVAKYIQPSPRGELEITTVNQEFLNDHQLKVQLLGRGFAWLDTGTHDSLSEASTFIEVIEKRQGLKVACLEGIALRHGWITADKMRELAKPMLKNQYGQYLLKVINELGLE